VGGKGDRPAVENRWWVDQQRDDRGGLIPRPPATFGGRFFRTGQGYEQDRAQRRLTDLNLKWFGEAEGPLGGWALLRLFDRDRFPQKKIERVKVAFSVPPQGRGVLVDSGNALRAIISSDAACTRLVEVRLGEDSTFDAWVQGEWVREVSFRGFEDALRRAPALVREYLQTARAAPLG
jgi:hypothetical protein